MEVVTKVTALKLSNNAGLLHYYLKEIRDRAVHCHKDTELEFPAGDRKRRLGETKNAPGGWSEVFTSFVAVRLCGCKYH